MHVKYMELTLPIDIKDSTGKVIGRLEEGAAEGSQFITLRLFNGDILNVRNVQGGTVDNPNLDLGAGSDGTSGPRGNVVVNWDVGDQFRVYNGRKTEVFGVNEKRTSTSGVNDRLITSRIPHRFYQGAFVRRTDGTWREL
jgi:hypothetical protein